MRFLFRITFFIFFFQAFFLRISVAEVSCKDGVGIKECLGRLINELNSKDEKIKKLEAEVQEFKSGSSPVGFANRALSLEGNINFKAQENLPSLQGGNGIVIASSSKNLPEGLIYQGGVGFINTCNALNSPLVGNAEAVVTEGTWLVIGCAAIMTSINDDHIQLSLCKKEDSGACTVIKGGKSVISAASKTFSRAFETEGIVVVEKNKTLKMRLSASVHGNSCLNIIGVVLNDQLVGGEKITAIRIR
jgi:hypothetical protein